MQYCLCSSCDQSVSFRPSCSAKSTHILAIAIASPRKILVIVPTLKSSPLRCLFSFAHFSTWIVNGPVCLFMRLFLLLGHHQLSLTLAELFHREDGRRWVAQAKNAFHFFVFGDNHWLCRWSWRRWWWRCHSLSAHFQQGQLVAHQLHAARRFGRVQLDIGKPVDARLLLVVAVFLRFPLIQRHLLFECFLSFVLFDSRLSWIGRFLQWCRGEAVIAQESNIVEEASCY